MKCTYDELYNFCKESFSYADVLRKIGLSPKSGGNYIVLKNQIEEYNIDISHFTGQAHNKNNFSISWMVKGQKYHSNYRFSLIELKGRQCDNCKLTEWLEMPIPLEVHHIDGDKYNNEFNNLQLLCPNCHSLTENYRNRK